MAFSYDRLYKNLSRKILARFLQDFKEALWQTILRANI